LLNSLSEVVENPITNSLGTVFHFRHSGKDPDITLNELTGQSTFDGATIYSRNKSRMDMILGLCAPCTDVKLTY
jgi:hypothetical protein